MAQTGVPDAAYEAAPAVFDERELVDLPIAISMMNAYNRMAISFRNTPQAALGTVDSRVRRFCSAANALRVAPPCLSRSIA